MRIAICDVYYLAAIESLYSGDPQLTEAPYADQHRAIMELSLGTGDAYSHGLRVAGHKAEEFVVNVDRIQAAWAREQGVSRTAVAAFERSRSLPRRASRQWLLHTVAHEQIDAFSPDVVFLQDLSFFSRGELRRLKRPGRMLVGQLGVGPPADRRLAEYDLIVSSLPRQVERLNERGITAEYFAIAFDERVRSRLAAAGLSTDPRAERDIPVAFVGGINADVHLAGTALLERLAEELDVQFWGCVTGDLPAGSPIRARYHGEAWGLDMYRLLARTRVALNRHSSVAEGLANNMRLFEATGVGACLLTEHAPNLPQLFAPGAEVATYRDADDLVATAQALLADAERRTAIAEAGQARTLRDHTYLNRMAELGEILDRHAQPAS